LENEKGRGKTREDGKVQRKMAKRIKIGGGK